MAKSHYIKHSVMYYIWVALKWLAVISPFVALFIKKKDVYFVNYNGTKMTFGLILLIGVGAWAVLREVKKRKGETYTASPMLSIVYWGIAYGLVYCFNFLLKDLTTIIFCGLIGQCLGFIFEVLAEMEHEKRKLYLGAEINAKVHKEVFYKGKKKDVVPYE